MRNKEIEMTNFTNWNLENVSNTEDGFVVRTYLADFNHTIDCKNETINTTKIRLNVFENTEDPNYTFGSAVLFHNGTDAVTGDEALETALNDILIPQLKWNVKGVHFANRSFFDLVEVPVGL